MKSFLEYRMDVFLGVNAQRIARQRCIVLMQTRVRRAIDERAVRRKVGAMRRTVKPIARSIVCHSRSSVWTDTVHRHIGSAGCSGDDDPVAVNISAICLQRTVGRSRQIKREIDIRRRIRDGIRNVAALKRRDGEKRRRPNTQ